MNDKICVSIIMDVHLILIFSCLSVNSGTMHTFKNNMLYMATATINDPLMQCQSEDRH